jgi:3(or 17)beta-hydroxysteroid dehydrogenase
MKRFAQKVALVTGGASELGKAIAQRLAADGARVVISDLQCELGTAAAKEGGFTFVEQDVCDEAQWTLIVGDIEKRFGCLDILINNAGILGPIEAASPESTSLANWKRIFAVNVEGVFLGCRSAIPALRRAGSGSIVNVASMADRMATPHATAYGASKAAVRQLTRSVAQHCAQQRLNVRCNSVHPGMIRTPLLDQSIGEVAQRRGVSFDQVAAEFKASVPLGNFTLAEDVAAAVAFLASEDARHVTGSSLIVDGGIVHCNTYRAGDA